MSSFQVNVRLEGEPEVLDVTVSSGRDSLWRHSAAHLRTLNPTLADTLIQQDDEQTFESFLHLAGSLFGKDPTLWERQGRPNVEYSEKDYVRTIKTTETFWGLQMKLSLLPNLYHPRLTGYVQSDPETEPEYIADLDYSHKRKIIGDEQQWQHAISGHPMSSQKRRKELQKFLIAKMQHADPDLQEEGLHGMLELCINHHHHQDFDHDAMDVIVSFIRRDDEPLAHIAASVLWALAPAAHARHIGNCMGAIKHLLALLKQTFAVEPQGDTPECAQQLQAQKAALGALAVSLVDVRCRAQYLAVEPSLATLLHAAAVLPGYPDAFQAERRIVAAKAVAASVQRDAFVRDCLVQNGQLKTLTTLLEAEGPGAVRVQFCMASALATLVLDEDVMHAVKDRGEAPMLFVHAIEILKGALARLDPATPEPPDDPDLTVRMAEAMAQAMWGAAYYCTLPDGGGVEDHHVTSLGVMGVSTWTNTQYPLGRVAHCIAATMASLASNARCAEVLMAEDKHHGAVAALMLLAKVHDRGVFEQSGHVRASAACALSFLACHNMGARGDDCLTGPYRPALLEQGALDCLLQAALAPPPDMQCKAIVEMAASVGVMYLSTMAGDLEAPPLVMLATLLNNNGNLLMVENLMAAVWILLRSPHNRHILGTAFADNPVLSSTLKGQMQDVVDVHEIQEDLFVRRGTETQADAARQLSKSQSNLGPEQKDSAAQGFSGTDPLEKVQEGDEQELAATPGNLSQGAIEPAPSLMSQLPSHDGGPARQASDRPVFDDEPALQSSPSKVVLLQSNPGLAKLAEEVPADAVPIENFEDVSNTNWGLDMLVRVGESWAPNLLDMTSDTVKAPLLKLFEFLVASMCLFIIDDDEPLPPLRDDVFCAAPPPAPADDRDRGAATWWSVDVPRPEPICDDSPAMLRAYEILCLCLTVRLPQAWKIVQLSLLTMWNVCARRPGAERHVVEKGLAVPLLDIVVQQHWPHSVRVMAAGFLASLAESVHNTASLGGLVPMLAANIVLVRSKVPLLEMVGARNLARTLYAAPRGAPNPTAALADAKAVAAHQGAVSALIRLLQCGCGRYAQLCAGKSLPTRPFVFASLLEDDPAEFTRDMANADGVLDTLHYTAAALLNLSTTKLNQLALAKRGMRSLLGARTLMAAVARGAFAAPEGRTGVQLSREQAIADMLTATVANIAAHVQNRSRLYRMELSGALAVQQELLGVPTRLRAAASAIVGAQKAHGPAGAAGVLLPPVPRSRSEEPGRPRPRARGGFDSAGRSIDTKLPMRMLPKAVFAPVLRQEQAPVGFSFGSAGGGMKLPMGTGGGDGDAAAPGADGLGGGAGNSNEVAEDMQATKLFQMWADMTFQGLQEEESSHTILHTKSFKMVDPETGEWRNERSGFPLLAASLRRPLTGMWDQTPERMAQRGRARWAPPVSEYRQSTAKSAPASGVAARLLCTDAPAEAAGVLTAAARELDKEGCVGPEIRALHIRPSTAERRGGQVPLAVLRPDTRSGEVGALPVAEKPGSPRLPGGPLAPHAGGSLPLSVVMAPQRARTTISFQPREGLSNGTSQRPTLTVFAHEPGSRVHKDLFPVYQMPNGQLGFMYYNAGRVQSEQEVPPPVPPTKPNSVPGALQQSMPLADVMDVIAKPPGSAPPFIPYKPAPPLVPLPQKHTLTVRRPHVLNDRAAFGDLADQPLQFVVEASTLVKTVVTTRQEDVEAPLAVEKEPWELPKSIFAARAKRGPQQCDAKDYFDTPRVLESMFEADWAKLMAKEKFSQNFLARECRGGDGEAAQVAAVRATLKRHYDLLVPAFMFYSCSVSTVPFFMGLNEFTALLDDCQIPDNESQGVKRSDLDTAFIVCTRKEKPKDGKLTVGSDNLLFRWEFLEALVRIAIAKYGKGATPVPPAEAIDMLVAQNLEPNVPAAARIQLNHFRTMRLYCEAVDDLLKKHEGVLRALYSRWRLRPPSGGLRTKLVKPDGWMKMMEALELVDDDFTLNNAMLCYVWSRMTTIDEVKDYSKFESLTFVDFLEALGLIADSKMLPMASDMAEAGINSLQWALAKSSGDTSAASLVPDIFKATNAAKARPLAAKLEVLLDLMFRKICHDPTDPANTEWSTDRVLRVLKKQDKDLGN